MKTGTIGTSRICEAFISAAEKAGGYEFTSAYSRDKERALCFAEKHKMKNSCCDLAEMAESDIDSVYIASPNICHYEQSKLFLSRGKNVLCEKPATTTKEQEEELIDLAETNGLIYCEAIMSLHVPAFDVLTESIKKIGNIRTANLIFCQLSSKYPAFLRNEAPNIFNPSMHAGCLMDIGVYNIYLACALFGKPDKIISDALFLSSGADSSGTAILKYNDLTVNLIYSKVGQNYALSEIIGDLGTVSINSVSQLTGIDIVKGGKRENLVPYEKSRDEIMGAEAAFFRDCVLFGRNNKYEFAKKTSLLVREITDEIREQNGFLF